MKRRSDPIEMDNEEVARQWGRKIVECGNGMNGFRLEFSGTLKLGWGSATIEVKLGNFGSLF